MFTLLKEGGPHDDTVSGLLTNRARQALKAFLDTHWEEGMRQWADRSVYRLQPFPDPTRMVTYSSPMQAATELLHWRAGIVDMLNDIWDVIDEPYLDLDECQDMEAFLNPPDAASRCPYCLTAFIERYRNPDWHDCLLLRHVRAKRPPLPPYLKRLAEEQKAAELRDFKGSLPVRSLYSIYRIQCIACGRSPASGHRCAEDDSEWGRRFVHAREELKLEGGEFVPVVRRYADHVFNKHGLTENEAARQGRLFRVIPRICRHCGWMNEERQIAGPNGSCLIVLILFVATAAIFHLGLKLHWVLTVMGTFAVVALYAMIMEKWWTNRWRTENGRLKLRQCEQCQSTDLILLADSADSFLMCPFCHTPNMRYDLLCRGSLDGSAS